MEYSDYGIVDVYEYNYYDNIKILFHELLVGTLNTRCIQYTLKATYGVKKFEKNLILLLFNKLNSI